MEIANLNKILNLLHEVHERNTSHVQKTPSTLGIDRRTLGLIVLPLEVGDDLKRPRVVRVKSLDEVCVELDLLQLVSVGEVLFTLKSVEHAIQLVREGLPLAVSLRLGVGGRRALVSSAAHSGGSSRVVGGHGVRRAAASRRREMIRL